MNRQIRPSERVAMKFIGALVAGALFLNGLPIAGAGLRSAGRRARSCCGAGAPFRCRNFPLVSAGKVSWNFELVAHEIPLEVARSPGGPTRGGWCLKSSGRSHDWP